MSVDRYDPGRSLTLPERIADLARLVARHEGEPFQAQRVPFGRLRLRWWLPSMATSQHVCVRSRELGFEPRSINGHLDRVDSEKTRGYQVVIDIDLAGYTPQGFVAAVDENLALPPATRALPEGDQP